MQNKLVGILCGTFFPDSIKCRASPWCILLPLLDTNVTMKTSEMEPVSGCVSSRCLSSKQQQVPGQATKCVQQESWYGVVKFHTEDSKQQQVPGQATKCVQQEPWYGVVKFHTEKDSKQQQVTGQATKCVQQEPWYGVVKFHTEKDSKQQQVTGQATKRVQQESWYGVVKFHTEKDSKQHSPCWVKHNVGFGRESLRQRTLQTFWWGSRQNVDLKKIRPNLKNNHTLLDCLFHFSVPCFLYCCCPVSLKHVSEGKTSF